MARWATNRLRWWVVMAVVAAGAAAGAARDAGAHALATPVVTGATTSSVGQNVATVTASVTPNLQDTQVRVRYGPTTPYVSQTTAQDLGVGSGPISFTAQLIGLTPGITYHAAVVATNGDGTTTSQDFTFTTLPPLPQSTGTPPAPAGIAEQGQTLTADHGRWTNNPTSYSYQWQDCDAGGAECVPISNAAGAAYTLTGSDAGHTIAVLVVATNGGGSNSVPSAATAVVLPLAPTSTGTPPGPTGIAEQGQTLTAADGDWTNNPASYSHQWQDCDAGGADCQAIPNATGATYTLTGSDVGHTVTVLVTAVNAGGSSSAQSAATGVVQPPPPAQTTTPATSPPPPSSTTRGPSPAAASIAGLRVSGDRLMVRIRCAGGRPASVCAGHVAVTSHVTTRSGRTTAASARTRRPRRRTRLVTVAAGAYTVSSGATRTVTLRLNGAGRALLKRLHRLPATVTATGTGTATGARPRRVTFTARPGARRRRSRSTGR